MTQPKSKSSSKKTKKTTAPAAKKLAAAPAKTAAAKPAAQVAAPVLTAAPVKLAAPAKTVASKAAPVAAEPVLSLKAVAVPVTTVTRAEFMELVRREAYRMAARRNFKNGSPFQDWVNAEQAVQGKLAAQGARLS